MENHTTDASSTQRARTNLPLLNLKPLRTLADSWDIDISSCLHDYLLELERVGHPVRHGSIQHELSTDNDASVNEGKTNFAQAALLLQNSSSVYSRKVEYLYTLVYAALDELIASTQHGKNESTKKKPAKSRLSREMEEFEYFDPDMDFLLLNDVLPTDNDGKIDLKPNENGKMFYDGSLNSTRISLDGPSVLRMEQSMIDNDVKDPFSALVSSAEARAVISTLANEGLDGSGGTFRLLSGMCDIGADGALLMPGSSLLGTSRREDTKDKKESSATPLSPSIFAMDEAAVIDSGGILEEDGGFMHDDPDDVDHDNDEGAGFVLNDNLNADNETAQYEVEIADTKCMKKRETDPWTMLDPHDIGTLKPRPLRVGVTYRLPPGIEEPPSLLVTGAMTKKSFKENQLPRRRSNIVGEVACIASKTYEQTVSIAEEEIRRRTSTELSDHDRDDKLWKAQIKKEKFAIPFNGLVFGNEFAYIAQAEIKRKAKDRRKKQKLLAEGEAVSLTAAAVNEKFKDIYEDDRDGDDDGPGFDFDGDNNDDYSDDNGTDTNKNVSLHDFDAAFSAGDAIEKNPGIHAAETFESLCRAHLKEFSRGAEKYAVETNLTKRVGTWQSKLFPILEEEERRPEFDIHKYGERILNTAKAEIENQKRISFEKGEKISNTTHFTSITKECEQYDICRSFLASLMLCNKENITFRDYEPGEVASPKSLQVEVLDSKLENPLESYLAPSLLASGSQVAFSTKN